LQTCKPLNAHLKRIVYRLFYIFVATENPWIEALASIGTIKSDPQLVIEAWLLFKAGLY